MDKIHNEAVEPGKNTFRIKRTMSAYESDVRLIRVIAALEDRTMIAVVEDMVELYRQVKSPNTSMVDDL